MDISGTLFYLLEIGIVIAFCLCVYYLLRPKPAIRRIWMGRVGIKKIQPNWGNQCILCGRPMAGAQCPQCNVTRPAALDQVVYQCLTENSGVLRRSEITSSIHVSNYELDESIERLTRAGKISPMHETKDVKGVTIS
jgi:hypothetical protein